MPDDEQVANPLLLKWVKKWLDQAKERNTKGVTAYKKAYNSLRICPITFQHPSEAKILAGIGETLSKRLTEEMNDYCRKNGLPMPKRARGAAARLQQQGLEPEGEPKRPQRRRSKKPYVPQLRSGPYAMLLALGEMDQDGRSGLTKEALIEAAQPHCNASFTVPKSANEHYTAWASMSKLIEKELVVERGRPIKRYVLTDEGWETAKALKATQQGQQLPGVGGGNTGGHSGGDGNAKSRTSTSRDTNPKGPDSDVDIFDLDDNNDSDDDIIEVDAYDFKSKITKPAPEMASWARLGKQDAPQQERIPRTGSNNHVALPEDGLEAAEIQTKAAASPIRVSPGAFTFHLILDSREVRAKKDRDYIQLELEKKGISPITRPLPLGDFAWVAKLNNPNLLVMNGDEGDEIMLDWIVERKRLDDLIQSIKDSRFREQKFRLGRSGIKNVVYLVEEMSIAGDVWQKSEEAVQTALASTQVVNDFFVKKTQTTDDTIRYIAKMTNMLKKQYEGQPLYVVPGGSITPQTYLPTITSLREEQPSKGFYVSYKSFESLCSKSDNLTLRDVYLKMLMCTRGITGEKALEIQARWKTPRDFVEAFDECGSGDAGRKRKREMVYDEMSEMVGRRKMGKALSAQIAEVWADGV